MGEYAELILNVDVCEICGEDFLEDGPGYPRKCSSCGGSDEVSDFDVYKHARQERRNSLEPGRIEYAIKQLEQIGFTPFKKDRMYIKDGEVIHLTMDGKQIDFWPFTGWFCGRRPIGNIKGRGIANLVKEIKKLCHIK